MRSPREALEGLTVLPAPSLGLRFLVYTMRAWTPAWTPKMSSVTGGLGRSPPAVTDTQAQAKGSSDVTLASSPVRAAEPGGRQPSGDMGTWGRLTYGSAAGFGGKCYSKPDSEEPSSPVSAQDNPHSGQGHPELGSPFPTFPWMCDCSTARGGTPLQSNPVLAGGGAWSRRRPESSLQLGGAAPRSGRKAQMRAFARFFNVAVTLNSWLCLRHLGAVGLLSQEGEGRPFGSEPWRCGVCACVPARSPGTPTLELLRTAGLDGRGGGGAGQCCSDLCEGERE